MLGGKASVSEKAGLHILEMVNLSLANQEKTWRLSLELSQSTFIDTDKI